MKTFIVFTQLSLITLFISHAQLDESTFDFWIGNWSLTWEDGDGTMGKGTNVIEKTLDGKVIQEHFQATEGKYQGMKGTSISVFNPQTNTWHQAWADNQGSYFDFMGEIDEDKKIFRTKGKELEDGSTLIQRMVFYNISEDGLTWDWESTKDGGDTWTLNWRIQYLKVEP